MREDLKELLQLLSADEYHTATELAERLNVSPKTVRTRIRELNELGADYKVWIESKPRYGFMLKEEQEYGVQILLENMEKKKELPVSNRERTNYLLIYLLNHSDYTKIEDLSGFLCVSRSTLQVSIREVEQILKKYHIYLDRRPNYGIRACGGEFDIRRCIGECLVKRDMLEGNTRVYSTAELTELAQKVLEVTARHKVFLPENEFENLLIQIYVALKRIKRGNIVSFDDQLEERKYNLEISIANEIVAEVEKWRQVKYSKDEIRYIVIYLAGIRSLGNQGCDGGNFVIREELDTLVVRVLELIYEEFRIELRNNFNLRMSLNQHMVPFDIRMRYHITISNPILDEIKQNYIFGYTLAKHGCRILEEYYGQEISEEEIGFFAMLLIFALEQKNTDIPKSRILIVCSAGGVEVPGSYSTNTNKNLEIIWKRSMFAVCLN